jgi:RNA polymerase sigma-70 factor (ECF subfamily)
MQSHYTNEEITEIYNRNIDSVYRVCFMYMKNKSDTEDMIQNTFLKLASHDEKFISHEHEAAWLMRVAINSCKSSLRSFWNRRVNLDEWETQVQSSFTTIPEPDETLSRVMKLKESLKTALYLHYYEDYSTSEIAKMMNKPEATVRGYLHRGRKALKIAIETEEGIYEI